MSKNSCAVALINKEWLLDARFCASQQTLKKKHMSGLFLPNCLSVDVTVSGKKTESGLFQEPLATNGEFSIMVWEAPITRPWLNVLVTLIL